MSKIVVGNWKMNGSCTLLKDFKDILQYKNFILALPYTLIHLAKTLNTGALIAAQDCSVFCQSGAYTGEISAVMLKDIGAEYVIIGHSERRRYFAECGNTIAQKIENAINAGLQVIYCVNEDYKLQISNEALQFLENIIVAYEPVSAIGTGNVSDADSITQICDTICELGAKRVMYGGSVNKVNIKEIIQVGKLYGVLVGGASLKIDEIADIIKASI